MDKRPNFLNRHPWLYVVLAFVFLIAAWATLFTITMKNQPEVIEIPAPQNR
jgi:hypothetical protein